MTGTIPCRDKYSPQYIDLVALETNSPEQAAQLGH
jgi:hypothetical protein